jgi:bifunctional non-homologous end joining protein LigD
MLARTGKLPTGAGWSFEPKWDGFRAILRTGDGYCVRSRRGWLMTELLLEFAALPLRGVFDGELVAFGTDGRPSFYRVCARMLNRDASVPSRSSCSTCSSSTARRHWPCRTGSAASSSNL